MQLRYIDVNSKKAAEWVGYYVFEEVTDETTANGDVLIGLNQAMPKLFDRDVIVKFGDRAVRMCARGVMEIEANQNILILNEEKKSWSDKLMFWR